MTRKLKIKTLDNNLHEMEVPEDVTITIIITIK